MSLSAFATHVSPRYAAKLLQHYGAIALFTEWEDTACEIRGATRRMSIPAAGSTGAASTDRFIDITLQESRDYPAGKVRLRGSRASGGRQGRGSFDLLLQLPCNHAEPSSPDVRLETPV